VTAVVSDGVSQRTLVSEVRFRYRVSVVLTTTKGGEPAAAATDQLNVRASKVAAGAKVSLYKVKGTKLKRVKGVRVKLDKDGKATFAVSDSNGRRKTAYVVVVAPTSTTFEATSPVIKPR
jgi:5-hydroxyisourate hydrolase-like protein (transthyretin family)